MRACDRVRDSGQPFAPRAPEFRAFCFDIPTRDDCEAYLRGQGEATPFTLAVARAIDLWNWRGSPTHEANKILQRAYDGVRKRVLAGEDLPPVLVAIGQEPEERTAAKPETVAEHMARIRAALGVTETKEEP
jgi:hypothetical protein